MNQLFIMLGSSYKLPYAWVGLVIRHRSAHLIRAVLEGVVFGFKDIFMLLRETGLKGVRQVRMSGEEREVRSLSVRL